MKRLSKRERTVIIICLALLTVILYTSTWQKVSIVNPRSASRHGRSNTAPLGADKLVFLEVTDFGTGAFLGLGSEDPAYRKFSVVRGVLSVGCDFEKPLRVQPRTKVALNLEQSTSAFDAAPAPLLIDRLPLHYISGAPLLVNRNCSTRISFLHHSLTITCISVDGTVYYPRWS